MSRRIAAVCSGVMLSHHRFILCLIGGFALLACLPTPAIGQTQCPGQGAPYINAGTPPTCQVLCVGDHYDVDNNASNGCEVPYTSQAGHDQTTAAQRPQLGCATQDTIQGSIPSDSRIHGNPAVPGFNASTGAAPQWWSTVADPNAIACSNSLYIAFQMILSSHPSCYQLTIKTDKSPANNPVIPDATGAATLIFSGLPTPAYSNGSTIYFEIQKVCTSSIRENVGYTITYSRSQPVSQAPPPAIPTAPTGVSANPAVGGITASWTAVTGAATYNLKVASSASGPFTAAQSTISGTSVTVTSLTPNTTYYVVVSAVNSAGESPNSSNPVSVLTPPAVPTNVVALPPAPNYMALMWAPSPGAASYSLNLGGTTVTATAAAANCPTGVGMCTYGASGLPSNLQTSCSVAATNSAGGQSAYSGAIYCATQ